MRCRPRFDLRSLSTANIQIAGQGDRLVVGGTINDKEAGLTGDLDIDFDVLPPFAVAGMLDFAEDRSETLEVCLWMW